LELVIRAEGGLSMPGEHGGRAQFELIDVVKIRPNKENPRGPNIRESDPHRENLKESIQRFGILVPLVVRPFGDGQYELIDGERRYWIARSLKIGEVPAYVLNGGMDSKAILQRMFQIHMNRDPWDAVQQCKASESIYTELRAAHGGDYETIVEHFARFSGTDKRTARNRVQFLRWPEAVKRSIYSDPTKHDSYWYVVEIEDKIVEPAQRNYPEYFQRVSVDEVRTFLYRKWEANTVKAAVDVRQVAVLTRAKFREKAPRKKALQILEHLVKDIEFTYEDALKEFAQEFPDLVPPKFPKPRAFINLLRNVTDFLSQYQPEFLATYPKQKSGYAFELTEAARSLIGAAKRFLARMKR
jgi:hypothetical protein